MTKTGTDKSRNKALNIMKTFIFTLLSSVLAFSIVSCSKEQQEYADSNMFECPLRMCGGLQDYADAATRAGISWQTNSRIYIRISSSVYGYALYNSYTGTWDAYLKGTPSTTSSGRASVYYFDNASHSSSYATLTSASGIYSDTSASYSYSSAGGLVLTTNIEPAYGRIRFKGSAGQTITLSGIRYKTRYTYSSDSYTNSTSSLSLTVGSSGYTDYVYGELSESSRKLTLVANGKTYTTYCSSSMYKSGQSGYLNIPTSSSHTGWQTDGDDSSSDADFSLEDFDSEECWDQSISETLEFALEDFEGEEDWSPKGSSAEVKLTDILAISDGYCFEYEFSDDAYSFVCSSFSPSSSYYNASDAEVADYLETYETESVAEYKENNYYSYYYDQTPNTEYHLCVLAFDKSGNRGVLNKYKVQTPSTSNQPIAALGSWSYSSNQWHIPVSMNSYCSSYYYICYSGSNISDKMYNIEFAISIYWNYVYEGDTSSKISNSNMNFSVASSYPIIAATWGVSSSGTLSGVVTSKGNSYYDYYYSAKTRSSVDQDSQKCRTVSKNDNKDIQVYYISAQ